MDRLQAMEMFVRVVETGSFSSAAREFGTTQPTATKQVAAMEARLKVRLLNRNTRGVSPTEAGALYYENCKGIVRAAQEADDLVQVRQTQAQGLLRVGSSVAFGRRVLVPLALDFMRQHPQLQVDLSFEDRYTDLVAQGIDVAVRMGKLADSSLGARYLGTNPWLVVASPRYLRKYGTPRRPADLSTHQALIYSSVQGSDQWRVVSPRGEAITVPVTGPLRSNNLSAVLAAARSHLGIAALPWYVAADSLAAGTVVEVLKGHSLPEQEIHAVYPSPKLVPRKVQAFIAYLQGRFGDHWWERLPKG
ncbi:MULTISPECIES: LysR family transcriptional regulator [Ramlibacter]|uniref:LysR family transcriptional regulator n=1 Tax=Ramlibacter pinisoli TaxID=2682844 RepID=A0A6N8IXW0_9BURK|nr:MULTISPECIES: LysR family transcriptional regulator [Ramlibacter]MBA2961481.1 LysR family transcriptional regulator [Ramlibacter sp. CGMCC 1.13660]MVQ31425.1 LysR family transcriptional regulator [Ramlibacter pinisoli]